MEPTFRVKMADEVIEVHPVTSSLIRLCEAYLTEDPPDQTIVLTSEDLDSERRISDTKASDTYLEELALNRRIAEVLLAHDTLLVHGSCIAVDGEGYLFTAPSGVGKSTHTRLWKAMFGDRAVMINDDKPFVRIADAGVTAYGSPWDGEHHLSVNSSVPLKAVCLLERDETNHIGRISPEEAFPVLFGRIYRPEGKEATEQLLPMVDRLVRLTGVYRLGCNTEPEAAQVSYAGMNS